jgi:hypothetical protein
VLGTLGLRQITAIYRGKVGLMSVDLSFIALIATLGYDAMWTGEFFRLI